MGCWSGTCAISNLPISYGDEIKLVILKSSIENRAPSLMNCSGYVYSTDLLQPAFFALSGKYDDYGMIEDIEKDWNYDLIYDYLKKKYGRVRIENERTEDWELEDFLRGIEREELKDDLNDTIQLSFVMVRKDIWDYICNSKDKSSLRQKFDDCFKDIYIEMEDLFFQYNNLFSSGGYGSSDFLAKTEYSEFVIKPENRDTVFNYWADDQRINMYMMHNRRGWMIQPGAGSQTEDWQEAINLSNEIIRIAQLKINKYKEQE